MIRRPQRSTPTDTLMPITTLRRSCWSRTVENLGGPADPAHLFSAQRIFDVGEPLSRKLERVIDMRLTARRRHEQVPKPGAPGLGLKLLDRLQRLPSIAGRELLCVALQ